MEESKNMQLYNRISGEAGMYLKQEDILVSPQEFSSPAIRGKEVIKATDR